MSEPKYTCALPGCSGDHASKYQFCEAAPMTDTFEQIVKRDAEMGRGTPTLTAAADRRALIAMVRERDAEIARLTKAHEATERAACAQAEQLGAEVARLGRALAALLHTPAVIDALNPSRLPHLGKCGCPYCAALAALRASNASNEKGE